MLMMQDQSITFSPCYGYWWRQMPMGIKIHVFFLFAVIIISIVKLLNVWRITPPFKKSPDASGSYFKLLRVSKTSIGQWMGCTVLSWVILTCGTLGQDLRELLCNVEAIDRATLFFITQDLLAIFKVTVCVFSFLYLIHWHLISRMSRQEQAYDKLTRVI